MYIRTTRIERGVMSGFFWSFPFWFPLLFFYPFLSPLLLTNQAPMISINEDTGTVFVLSLISKDICCTSLLHSVQHRNSDPRAPTTQAPSKTFHRVSHPPTTLVSIFGTPCLDPVRPPPLCSVSLSGYPDRGVVISPWAYSFPHHTVTLQSSP